MPTELTIVGSPNKVRSIAGYLGPEFNVEASVRHIRDLPQPSELPVTMKKGPYGKFAVNVEDDSTPYYIANPDKKKTVTQLKKALKEVDELYLTTDDDREGEAIAWHLQQVLKPKVPVRRMVFTEITRGAVTRAPDNIHELDIHLVDTQETRRILDRLVGYEVSPVLRRKVRAGLPAGHVQSVVTRLVAECECERMASRSTPYRGVETTLSAVPFAVDVTAHQEASFTARLVTLDGRRMAAGHDFNDDGQLRPVVLKVFVAHLHQVGATAAVEAIGRGEPRVVGMEDKSYKRRPAAPFTISTFQQEAPRKLRVNPCETMRVAQGLYENGFITYMCTGSTVPSGQAMVVAHSQVAELYGVEYAPERSRIYTLKSKGAQETHEAIRPAGDHLRTSAQVSGEPTGAQLRLYELIWKWTVASQMADAIGSTATVTVEVPLTPVAGGSRDSGPTFSTVDPTASGAVITFRGFSAAYEEGCDVERYQDDAGATAKDSKDVRLPAMIAGQELAALDAETSGHETTPPPRYAEASLVRALGEREIGHPPVYVVTTSIISDHGYVDHRDQALVSAWFAFVVTRLLGENSAEPVDYDFTASMERDLDRIAAGEEDRATWLRHFYNGQGGAGTEQAVQAAPNELEAAAAVLYAQRLRGLVDNLGEIDARTANPIEIGEGTTLRVGRYGPYLEDTEGKHANVLADLVLGELTMDKACELFARAVDDDRELGVDPASGHVIIAKDGRCGPYVTEVLPELEETAEAETAKTAKTAKLTKAKETTKAAKAAKPHTVSLLRSMDLSTVTLEQALGLLSLPCAAGRDPESGEGIIAQNGRYGPYLKKGADSRSLETEEQIFTATLEQALEIFAQSKWRRRQAAARGLLRELGQDPATEKSMVIKDGRFGPYTTDGQTNVTVSHSEDPATISAECAFELLADKRTKGLAKKRTTRKTTFRKAMTKKTTTKKAAITKKTTAQTATSEAVVSKED